MTSSEAFTLAKRKAKYSDYSWIVWRNRDGSYDAQRESYASVKLAMLACGTQGRFTTICCRSGHSLVTTWWIGVNMLNQLKRWDYNAWEKQAALYAAQRKYKAQDREGK